ncbi:unnamed protein product [marine sediment metagenome]|uniref:Uncharacterized protein n=1 Tax=marine sediment metagenome TaxID=412755 RepID=X1CG05_9ZZZZ
MKDLATFILGDEVHLWFDMTLYRRPLSYLPRLARLLCRMSESGNYQFRPFCGGTYGIVAEKVK